MTLQEFKGKFREEIGRVGHLSSPQATDPFKTALYRALDTLANEAFSKSGGPPRPVAASSRPAEDSVEKAISEMNAHNAETEGLKAQVATMSAQIEALTEAVAGLAKVKLPEQKSTPLPESTSKPTKRTAANTKAK